MVSLDSLENCDKITVTDRKKPRGLFFDTEVMLRTISKSWKCVFNLTTEKIEFVLRVQQGSQWLSAEGL